MQLRHCALCRFATLVASIGLLAPSLAARPTTQTAAFTYQGVLKQAGAPLSGSVDLQFRLFDAASAGSPIGSMLPINAVTVANGTFATTVDFGALALNGEERWLEIAVASPAGGGVGPFTTLAPRQKLASAPYAAFALNAALSGNYSSAVSFANVGNTFAGTFTGDGAGLTNLNAASLSGTIGSALLLGTYGNTIAFSNASNTFNGSFSGSGASLTSLNASNIASGNLNIARMPTGGAWPLTSNLNINSNALVVEQASGDVGIGTSNPAFGLSVVRSPSVNNLNPVALFQQAGTGSSVGAVRVQNSAGNHFNLGIAQNNDFALNYNLNISQASDLLRITPSGNMGLGTLAPVNRLDVEGSAAIGAAYAGTNIAPANGLLVEGRVGLGAPIPDARLHIREGETGNPVTLTATPLMLESTIDNWLSMMTDATHLSGIAFGRPGATMTDVVHGGIVYNEALAGGMELRTGGNVTRLAIDSTGKVGLGTTAPMNRLDVDGGVAIGTTFAGAVVAPASGLIVSGKLGVGVSSPTERLDVSGNARLGGTLHLGGELDIFGALSRILMAGGTGSGMRVDYDLDMLRLINFSHGGMAFYTNEGGSTSFERVRIADDGNVGIGRIPLANKLEVAGDASKSTAGSWLANSDRRIKTDIRTVDSALDTLDRVRLASFRYTPEYLKAHPAIEDRRYLNVIAQEFAQVFPDHVKGSAEFLPTGEEILQVDIHPLTIYSAAAIQELRAEKDAEIASLRDRIAQLESRVERLLSTHHASGH